MISKVSLATNLCGPFPCPLSVHESVSFWEMITPIMWPIGFVLHQNKLTKTVFHKNQFMALDGHDCGHMIIHLGPPALASKLPLIILFSQREMKFSASKVKADDEPIGCSYLFRLLPMMTCGSPFNSPTSYPYFSVLNSVSVNMTFGDLAAGVFDIIVGFLFEKLKTSKMWEKETENLLSIKNEFIASLVGYENAPQFFVGRLLGQVVSVFKVVATGEGSFEILSIGSGYFSANFSVDPTSGVSFESNLLTMKGELQTEGENSFEFIPTWGESL